MYEYFLLFVSPSLCQDHVILMMNNSLMYLSEYSTATKQSTIQLARLFDAARSVMFNLVLVI